MTNANKTSSGNTWVEYRRLVLAELERLDAAISKLVEANLEQEKELVEIMSACKEELAERLQKLKDTVDNRQSDLKNELEKRDRYNIDEFRKQIRSLDDTTNRLSTEIKVIKAKAAFFGFLAGLGIAIASLALKIFWDK